MTAPTPIWWDCHTHAFGPAAKFPPVSDAAYTTPAADPADHVVAASSAGFAGVVWVQPSIYGYDNSCQIAQLERAGNTSRAVIAPPAFANGGDLRGLHEIGVRGLRLNLVSRGGNGLETLEPFRRQLKELGWHLAAFLNGTQGALLDEVMARIEAPVVLDHFGYVGRSPAPDIADFSGLYRHLDGGRLWVKVSAPYQLSTSGWPWPEVERLALELLRRNPERVLFGSNWPHVGQTAPHRIADLRQLTEKWLSSAGVEPGQVFSTNPSQLYA